MNSVCFVLFNGDTLKVMDVYYSDYCYEDVLIERVGGIQGIFPISHSLCEAFYFRRCYEDSDIGLIKFTQDPCDTTYTSTNDVLVSDNISLSPNPVSDILKIDMSDSDFSIQSINIISIEGKVVDSYWDINTPDFIVPFNSFPNGIYLIKIVAEDERVMTSRIVKH